MYKHARTSVFIHYAINIASYWSGNETSVCVCVCVCVCARVYVFMYVYMYVSMIYLHQYV